MNETSKENVVLDSGQRRSCVVECGEQAVNIRIDDKTTDLTASQKFSELPDDVQFANCPAPEITFGSSGCSFGLSYNDHNYAVEFTGAGSPPVFNSEDNIHRSPTGYREIVTEEFQSPPSIPIRVRTQSASSNNGAPGQIIIGSTIRCVCQYTHDDGRMVQCSKCNVWQHFDCLSTDNSSYDKNMSHECETCSPRTIDYGRALEIQRNKLASSQTTSLHNSSIGQQVKRLSIDPTKTPTIIVSASAVSSCPIIHSRHLIVTTVPSVSDKNATTTSCTSCNVTNTSTAGRVSKRKQTLAMRNTGSSPPDPPSSTSLSVDGEERTSVTLARGQSDELLSSTLLSHPSCSAPSRSSSVLSPTRPPWHNLVSPPTIIGRPHVNRCVSPAQNSGSYNRPSYVYSNKPSHPTVSQSRVFQSRIPTIYRTNQSTLVPPTVATSTQRIQRHDRRNSSLFGSSEIEDDSDLSDASPSRGMQNLCRQSSHKSYDRDLRPSESVTRQRRRRYVNDDQMTSSSDDDDDPHSYSSNPSPENRLSLTSAISQYRRAMAIWMQKEYQEADQMVYSQEIEKMMQRINENQTGENQADARIRERLKLKHCRLVSLASRMQSSNPQDGVLNIKPFTPPQAWRVLESTHSLRKYDTVIEFKGRMLLKSEYEKDNDQMKHFNPFVLFYECFGGPDLCLNASHYGNDARFIRRSCTPNCDIGHLTEGGRLHLIVRALCDIPIGTELTIGFDFDYKQAPYIECGCDLPPERCPVRQYTLTVYDTTIYRPFPKSGQIRVRRKRLLSRVSSRTSDTNESYCRRMESGGSGKFSRFREQAMNRDWYNKENDGYASSESVSDSSSSYSDASDILTINHRSNQSPRDKERYDKDHALEVGEDTSGIVDSLDEAVPSKKSLQPYVKSKYKVGRTIKLNHNLKNESSPSYSMSDESSSIEEDPRPVSPFRLTSSSQKNRSAVSRTSRDRSNSRSAPRQPRVKTTQGTNQVHQRRFTDPVTTKTPKALKTYTPKKDIKTKVKLPAFSTAASKRRESVDFPTRVTKDNDLNQSNGTGFRRCTSVNERKSSNENVKEKNKKPKDDDDDLSENSRKLSRDDRWLAAMIKRIKKIDEQNSLKKRRPSKTSVSSRSETANPTTDEKLPADLSETTVTAQMEESGTDHLEDHSKDENDAKDMHEVDDESTDPMEDDDENEKCIIKIKSENDVELAKENSDIEYEVPSNQNLSKDESSSHFMEEDDQSNQLVPSEVHIHQKEETKVNDQKHITYESNDANYIDNSDENNPVVVEQTVESPSKEKVDNNSTKKEVEDDTLDSTEPRNCQEDLGPSETEIGLNEIEKDLTDSQNNLMESINDVNEAPPHETNHATTLPCSSAEPQHSPLKPQAYQSELSDNPISPTVKDEQPDQIDQSDECLGIKNDSGNVAAANISKENMCSIDTNDNTPETNQVPCETEVSPVVEPCSASRKKRRTSSKTSESLNSEKIDEPDDSKNNKLEPEDETDLSESKPARWLRIALASIESQEKMFRRRQERQERRKRKLHSNSKDGEDEESNKADTSDSVSRVESVDEPCNPAKAETSSESVEIIVKEVDAETGESNPTSLISTHEQLCTSTATFDTHVESVERPSKPVGGGKRRRSSRRISPERKQEVKEEKKPISVTRSSVDDIVELVLSSNAEKQVGIFGSDESSLSSNDESSDEEGNKTNLQNSTSPVTSSSGRKMSRRLRSSVGSATAGLDTPASGTSRGRSRGRPRRSSGGRVSVDCVTANVSSTETVDSPQKSNLNDSINPEQCDRIVYSSQKNPLERFARHKSQSDSQMMANCQPEQQPTYNQAEKQSPQPATELVPNVLPTLIGAGETSAPLKKRPLPIYPLPPLKKRKFSGNSWVDCDTSTPTQQNQTEVKSQVTVSNEYNTAKPDEEFTEMNEPLDPKESLHKSVEECKDVNTTALDEHMNTPISMPRKKLYLRHYEQEQLRINNGAKMEEIAESDVLENTKITASNNHLPIDMSKKDKEEQTADDQVRDSEGTGRPEKQQLLDALITLASLASEKQTPDAESEIYANKTATCSIDKEEIPIGPRTPSEPPDENLDEANAFTGDTWPEFQCSNDIDSNDVVEDLSIQTQEQGHVEEEVMKEAQLLKRIHERDRQIMDMQELKSLERRKAKLEAQLRYIVGKEVTTSEPNVSGRQEQVPSKSPAVQNDIVRFTNHLRDHLERLKSQLIQPSTSSIGMPSCSKTCDSNATTTNVPPTKSPVNEKTRSRSRSPICASSPIHSHAKSVVSDDESSVTSSSNVSSTDQSRRHKHRRHGSHKRRRRHRSAHRHRRKSKHKRKHRRHRRDSSQSSSEEQVKKETELELNSFDPKWDAWAPSGGKEEDVEEEKQFYWTSESTRHYSREAVPNYHYDEHPPNDMAPEMYYDRGDIDAAPLPRHYPFPQFNQKPPHGKSPEYYRVWHSSQRGGPGCRYRRRRPYMRQTSQAAAPMPGQWETLPSPSVQHSQSVSSLTLQSQQTQQHAQQHQIQSHQRHLQPQQHHGRIRPLPRGGRGAVVRHRGPSGLHRGTVSPSAANIRQYYGNNLNTRRNWHHNMY